MNYVLDPNNPGWAYNPNGDPNDVYTWINVNAGTYENGEPVETGIMDLLWQSLRQQEQQQQQRQPPQQPPQQNPPPTNVRGGQGGPSIVPIGPNQYGVVFNGAIVGSGTLAEVQRQIADYGRGQQDGQQVQYGQQGLNLTQQYQGNLANAAGPSAAYTNEVNQRGWEEALSRITLNNANAQAQLARATDLANRLGLDRDTLLNTMRQFDITTQVDQQQFGATLGQHQQQNDRAYQVARAQALLTAPRGPADYFSYAAKLNSLRDPTNSLGQTLGGAIQAGSGQSMQSLQQQPTYTGTQMAQDLLGYGSSQQGQQGQQSQNQPTNGGLQNILPPVTAGQGINEFAGGGVWSEGGRAMPQPLGPQVYDPSTGTVRHAPVDPREGAEPLPGTTPGASNIPAPPQSPPQEASPTSEEQNRINNPRLTGPMPGGLSTTEWNAQHPGSPVGLNGQPLNPADYTYGQQIQMGMVSPDQQVEQMLNMFGKFVGSSDPAVVAAYARRMGLPQAADGSVELGSLPQFQDPFGRPGGAYITPTGSVTDRGQIYANNPVPEGHQVTWDDIVNRRVGTQMYQGPSGEYDYYPQLGNQLGDPFRTPFTGGAPVDPATVTRPDDGGFMYTGTSALGGGGTGGGLVDRFGRTVPAGQQPGTSYVQPGRTPITGAQIGGTGAANDVIANMMNWGANGQGAYAQAPWPESYYQADPNQSGERRPYWNWNQTGSQPQAPLRGPFAGQLPTQSGVYGASGLPFYTFPGQTGGAYTSQNGGTNTGPGPITNIQSPQSPQSPGMSLLGQGGSSLYSPTLANQQNQQQQPQPNGGYQSVFGARAPGPMNYSTTPPATTNISSPYGLTTGYQTSLQDYNRLDPTAQQMYTGLLNDSGIETPQDFLHNINRASPRFASSQAARFG